TLVATRSARTTRYGLEWRQPAAIQTQKVYKIQQYGLSSAVWVEESYQPTAVHTEGPFKSCSKRSGSLPAHSHEARFKSVRRHERECDTPSTEHPPVVSCVEG
ncbi:unnamed protein product, partial [Ectocarpus sp. 12 AP-2014]